MRERVGQLGMRCRATLIVAILALAVSGCVSVDGAPSPGCAATSFTLQDPYRAWQGVAMDSTYVYVLTDRNERFELEDIVSVFTYSGARVREFRNAYKGKDSTGKFMSFGDGKIIDNVLYVPTYNFNAGGSPYVSRVLRYSVPDLELISEHDIGDGVAESVTKHGDSYWVTYHDRMEVREFDLGFHPLRSYALSEPMGEYGGYQGAYWEGDDFLAQMHGPNAAGLHASKGLDRYHFTGTAFVFVRTEKPLTYGTGQGVAVYAGCLLQNDRPDNSIVVRR